MRKAANAVAHALMRAVSSLFSTPSGVGMSADAARMSACATNVRAKGEIFRDSIPLVVNDLRSPPSAPLSPRSLAVSYLAPSRQHSSVPFPATPQSLGRPGFRLAGPPIGHGSYWSHVPSAGGHREPGGGVLAPGGGARTLRARLFRGDGQPRPCVAAAEGIAEPVDEVAQGLHGTRRESPARQDRRAILATGIVRSLGKGRTGVEANCVLHREQSSESGTGLACRRVSLVVRVGP